MARSSPKLNKVDAQKDWFIEAARKIGADEDEAAFKAKLAVIARQKPKAEKAGPEHHEDGENT